MKPLHKTRGVLAVAASFALVTIAACSGNSSTPTGAATGATGGEGGGSKSVSVAMTTPSWIMPISVPGKTQGENGIFRSLIYPTLYNFTLEGSEDYNIKKERSLAEVPKISDDGLTYEITLKDLKWSDGEPITTRDVEFWYNLIKNNKEEWASYREGGFPDNVAEFKVIDEKTLSFTTTEVFAPGYFVGNQLNSIVPMPHHVWSKSGDDAEVDPELDRSEEGAKAIFAYLKKASEDPNSFATNPLWQTVSGPWKLKSYVPSGEVVMEANGAYEGEDKAKLETVSFKPFTSDDSQFNTLRSGGIDYGYIPAGSVSQKDFVESQGYTVEPWYGWSITYMPFNFNNPETGPIFKQKYVRQAMQHLIDQETISKVVWQDMAAPTCGPIPQEPGAAGSLQGCVYDFNPDKAKELLESHGWDVKSDGVTTCTNPGTGEGQCGEGIDAGKELRFKVTSQSGFSATTKMFAELKSQFAKLGIVLDIQEVPDSVAVSQACKPDQECTWDLSFFGSEASWYFPVYASGQRLFATDAPVNLGSYSDAKADELIEKTLRSSDEAAMKEYNDYLAEDLPVLWMPNPVNRVSAFKSDITGISPQEPTLGMYPQDWSR